MLYELNSSTMEPSLDQIPYNRITLANGGKASIYVAIIRKKWMKLVIKHALTYPRFWISSYLHILEMSFWESISTSHVGFFGIKNSPAV